MRLRIVSFFNNIDDAKNAFGRIKKESWNKANLAVLFRETGSENPAGAGYEFASDNWMTVSNLATAWPGVDQVELSGIGRVYLGTNFPDLRTINSLTREHPGLKQGLQEQKIVTVVEVNPEIQNRVRVILASNGAEIINPQVTAVTEGSSNGKIS